MLTQVSLKLPLSQYNSNYEAIRDPFIKKTLHSALADVVECTQPMFTIKYVCCLKCQHEFLLLLFGILMTIQEGSL